MAMSTEDRIAANQARAAAAAAAAAARIAAAAPAATPLDKFLGQSGLPGAPPFHTRLYDVELNPAYVQWRDMYGVRIAAAENNARANTAEWRAVVQAYNTGGTIPAEYWGLLNRMRLYYTDGAANPGRLAPETAAQALTRWAMDAAPSKVEGLVNQVVPVALTIAAAVAGADILMGGALVAPAAAAPVAAAPVTTAQAVTAAAYDPIAAMTGAGVGVTDAAAAAAAASAPGVASAGAALAEMQGAQWGALITGNVAAPVATAAELAASEAVKSTGGKMGSIFDNISGTISNIGKTVSNTYGTILDTQLKMAQLDALKARAKADLYQQPVTGGGVSGGGMNIGMIGIMAVLALGGLMLYMRRG